MTWAGGSSGGVVDEEDEEDVVRVDDVSCNRSSCPSMRRIWLERALLVLLCTSLTDRYCRSLELTRPQKT